MGDHGSQGHEAYEQLENMRAEVQSLQQELESARGQTSRAAELQAQVLISACPHTFLHAPLNGHRK